MREAFIIPAAVVAVAAMATPAAAASNQTLYETRVVQLRIASARPATASASFHNGRFYGVIVSDPDGGKLLSNQNDVASAAFYASWADEWGDDEDYF